jgi:hypothetical protein
MLLGPICLILAVSLTLARLASRLSGGSTKRRLSAEHTMEPLDRIVLLSAADTYVVPATVPGSSTPVQAIYLRQNANVLGDIDVYLNSTAPTDYFATLTGTADTIEASFGGLLFVDQVPAAAKPTGGIFFIGGGGGSTVEIDGGSDDHQFNVLPPARAADTPLDRTVTVWTNDGVGIDSFATGIDNLTLKVNKNDATVDVPTLLQHLVIDTGTSTNATITLGADNPDDNDGRAIHDAVIQTGAGEDTVNIFGALGTETTVSEPISASVDFGAGDGSLSNALNVSGPRTVAYLPAAENNIHDVSTAAGGAIILNHSGDWVHSGNMNTFGTLTMSGGTLDLGAQQLVVLNGQAAAASQTIGYIASAYGLQWVDGGIISSYATAHPGREAVGYAVAADTTLVGVGLSGNEILLRPTVAGDCNLDGTVEGLLGQADNVPFTLGGDRWCQGDFNYSGMVDSADQAFLGTDNGLTFPPSTGTHEYAVPTSGVSDVYLKMDTGGGVDVFLGNSGSPAATVTADGDGVIGFYATSPGITFHDQAFNRGAVKFYFVGAGDTTLRVEAGDAERGFFVQGTTTSATIVVSDFINVQNPIGHGTDVYFAGVSNLTLRTNDHVVTDPNSERGTGVDVRSLAQDLTVDTGASTYDEIQIAEKADTAAWVVNAVIHTGAGHDYVSVGGDGFGPGVITVYGGSGPGNEVHVHGSNEVVHLAGTQNLALLDLNLDQNAPGTAYVDTPSTITTCHGPGTVYFTSGSGTSNVGTFDVTGKVYVRYGAVVNGTFASDTSGTVFVEDGGIANGGFDLSGTLDVESGGVANGGFDMSGTVLVEGGGVVNVTTVATINDIELLGVMHLPSSGQSHRLNRVTTLHMPTVGGEIVGLLDLGHQDLLVAPAGTSASTIRSYLIDAYTANQDWSGRGISSSFAIGNPTTYSMGYAVSTDQSAQDAGITIAGDKTLGDTGFGGVLVRAVLTGDANMDQHVDFFDIAQVLGYRYNGGGSNARYTDGDLDYDGKVDFFDISVVLSANYNGVGTF